MLGILFKAILIYAFFRIAMGIYNAYRLSKKIKEAWRQNSGPSSPNHDEQKIFEAKFRHLDDD